MTNVVRGCYWCDILTSEIVVLSFVDETEAVNMCTSCQIENGYKQRTWFPHLDFSGNSMRKGEFRETYPMDEER